MYIARVPERTLGATGVKATVFGLGGEGILRTFGYETQARGVIEAALAEDVTYFDSARAYAGSEEYYGRVLGAARDKIFLTSKAHDRTRRGALAMLDQTLRNMRVNNLDLWQLHDLRTSEELDEIMAPGGAYEAFIEAKRVGKTRFIGLTGHYDPSVLLAAIEQLHFDTLLIPVNPCEACAEAFSAFVAPKAMELGLGVIGMKVLSRGLLTNIAHAPSIQELVDYALSQPIHIVIIGCDNVAQVRQNAQAARQFSPMPAQAQRALEQRLQLAAPQALYYRM
jgi:aryl-alcohol dehydrogenase-like predicted oxidoreductase